MTNSNTVNEAFEALAEPKELQCLGFGIMFLFRHKGKVYMRLTDATRCCHIYYTNNATRNAWDGIADDKLIEELSAAYDDSPWAGLVDPLTQTSIMVGAMFTAEGTRETLSQELH